MRCTGLCWVWCRGAPACCDSHSGSAAQRGIPLSWVLSSVISPLTPLPQHPALSHSLQSVNLLPWDRMGTGMEAQGAPCSTSTTVLLWQRALCSRRNCTRRLCSPGSPPFSVDVQAGRMRMHSGGCLFPVSHPHPLLFGCSRDAGARAMKKPGGRASCLLAAASLRLGLLPGTSLEDPRAQDGAPPSDSTPQGHYTGGCTCNGGATAKASRERQGPCCPPQRTRLGTFTLPKQCFAQSSAAPLPGAGTANLGCTGPGHCRAVGYRQLPCPQCRQRQLSALQHLLPAQGRHRPWSPWRAQTPQQRQQELGEMSCASAQH